MKLRSELLLCLQLSLALCVPTCRFTGTHGTTFFCRASVAADYFLRRGLVSDNNRTNVVILRSCRITDIDYESFDGLPGVHTIDLSLNKIRILKLGILDESQHVKKLNISYNAIGGIPLGLFDQMPNLEVLDARGNKFKSFELGVFDPTKKLRHLDVSNNELMSENLSPYLLDKNTRLTFVDFSHNDMAHTSENILNGVTVLDLLNLDSCSLDLVPEFAIASNMGSLRNLLLSGNQISSITNAYTFRHLVGLQILDLTGNKIVSLHQNVFKPMRKLSILTLRYNRLQVLPETIFHNLPDLSNLDLSHNAIQYIRAAVFQGLPRLKRLNLSINRLTFMPENICDDLIKSGTILVKFYFNQNPWQCACLKAVLKEVKVHEIVYNDNKYKGKVPVCVDPEQMREHCRRTIDESTEIAKLFDDTLKQIL